MKKVVLIAIVTLFVKSTAFSQFTTDQTIDKNYATLFLGSGGDVGPHGIVFDDSQNGSPLIQLVYRTTPNQLLVEKVIDESAIFSIDADNEFSFFSGYLGIGTDNPERKLHIKDDRIKISHSSSSPGIELVDDSDGDQFNLYHHRVDDRFLITDKNDAKLFSLTKEGKVGIGVYTPDEALDIEGNMKISQDIIGSSLILDLDAGTNPKKITSNQVGCTSTLEFQTYSYESSSLQTRLLLRGGSDNSIELYDKNLQEFVTFDGENGRVGIGVANPDSKLVVDGKIRSEEIKVEIIDGPDYVFEPEYELRTLKETKEYIAQNKHLPEIPSAKEMEANGIELGDMNMRLLKKIEELTLYHIDLLERLQQQSEQLQEQQKRIEKLENKSH